MGKKISVVDREFACNKCEQNVTFRVSQITFTSDEGVLMGVEPVVDKILNYGTCPVAGNAKIPGHPLHQDLVECPVYASLK